MSAPPPVLLLDPVNRNHALNRGRVAWWLALPGIDGGKTLYDLMGLRPGILTNMITSASGWRRTTRPGGWGHLLCDGVDDYIDCNPLPALGSTMTIAAWGYAARNNKDQSFLAAMPPNGSDASCNFPYTVYGIGFGSTATANVPYLDFELSTTNRVQCYQSLQITANQWYRLVGTYDGTNMILYANGVQVASAAQTGTITASAKSLVIGRQSGGCGGQHEGGVDDVSVWNRVLSASEVKADYDLSRLGYPGVLNFGLPGLLGSPALGTAYSQTGADTLTLTDTQSRFSVFARTGAESLTLTDTAARATLFARALAESLTGTDTASRFGDFARSATETLSVTETLSRYGVFARALAESLTASDTLARNADYLRSVAEALTLSDAEARSAAFVRSAAEALTLSESLLTDLIGPGGSLFARSFEETLTLTEARAAVWSFTRRGTDTLSLTDALTARQRAILRQFAETITAADVSSASLAGVLSAYLAETLNLSDALSRRLASAISGAAVLRVKGAAASHSPTGQAKTAETKTGGITGRPGPN